MEVDYLSIQCQKILSFKLNRIRSTLFQKINYYASMRQIFSLNYLREQKVRLIREILNINVTYKVLY